LRVGSFIDPLCTRPTESLPAAQGHLDVDRVYLHGIGAGARALGSPTMGKVDAAAVKEITKFQQEAGYASYEIKGRRYVFFPSAYEYTVLLSH
jgi:hypothetical protein